MQRNGAEAHGSGARGSGARDLPRGVPLAAVDPTGLDDFLPYQMNRITSRMNQMLSELLVQEGRSFQEWRVLLVLAHRGAVNIRRLSDETVVPHSTLSRLLVRMEGQGSLTRSVSPQDGRTVMLELTEAGHREYEHCQEHAMDIYEQAFGGVDTATRAAFRAMLRRVTGNLGLLGPERAA